MVPSPAQAGGRTPVLSSQLDFVLPTTSVAGPGWERTGLCSCDLAGGSASQPLCSCDLAGGRLPGCREEEVRAVWPGAWQMPTSSPSEAPSPVLPPAPRTAGPRRPAPSVSLGPLTIRAHSLGQLRPARGGYGEHPGSQRGLALPRSQPPEDPCVVGTSPYAFTPRTEMWGGRLGRQLQRPR